MDLQAFSKDLHDLMVKHGVTCIGVEIDGDTHGITENFIVTDDKNKDHTINPYNGYLDLQDLRVHFKNGD